MRGELKQRRLVKVSMEGDMRLVPSPVVHKENHISKTAPYRQIFVRKRDRNEMKVPVSIGSVRVTLENDGTRSEQNRRGRGHEAKRGDTFQKPPEPALVSDNDESSVPEDHLLKQPGVLSRPRGSGIRHPSTAFWLRKHRGQPHPSFPPRRRSTKSSGECAPKPMQGKSMERSPVKRNLPARKITRMRGGVKVGEGVDVGSAFSGSNHGDATSHCGSEGSHSERCFASPVHRETNESVPAASDGCGHSFSEVEKNDIDCWEPSETGHNRVIKRRKLSEQELHMACMRRNTLPRSRRSLEKSSYRDCMKRAIVRSRLPHIDLKQRSPNGYTARHKTRDNIAQEYVVGARHGSEGRCDTIHPTNGGGRAAGHHGMGVAKSGRESERLEAMSGGGRGGGGKDPCFIKDDRDSEGLDAAETFKVNTDGMRWYPGGYMNQEGRVARFCNLSDIVDQVSQEWRKTYQPRSPLHLVVQRLPRDNKSQSPTLYTSPVQSTRSSRDTCTPLELSSTMSNSGSQYAPPRVLNVEGDVPPVSNSNGYQDIRNSNRWRGNYVAKPVEVVRSHGEWGDVRGASRAAVQEHVNSNQHHDGVPWSDYGHDDLAQPREEVILIPRDRLQHMNFSDPDDSAVMPETQAKLKKQLVDLLNRHGLAMPVGGMGTYNSNPPPPPWPSPNLPMNNNPYGVGVNMVGDGELGVQHQTTVPAQKARFHSGRSLTSRLLRGGAEGGAARHPAPQSMYMRLANQGELGGSNGVADEGGTVPVMFLKRQGLMRLRK